MRRARRAVVQLLGETAVFFILLDRLTPYNKLDGQPCFLLSEGCN